MYSSFLDQSHIINPKTLIMGGGSGRGTCLMH